MKTTFVIDDKVLERLWREAALRLFLERREPPPPLPDLPSFASGGAVVDVADREALYQAMEGR